MANDLNQCQFIGRLGDSPDVKYMPNGDAVANFVIACGEKWKDKNGQPQESTEWVRCTAYRKLAEIIGEYLAKGSQVYVSGKMKTRKWQDQQGQDRYTTEIIVNNMQMLGGGNNNGGQANQSGYQQQQPQKNHQQSGQAQQPNQGKKPPLQEPDFDFDDDIPFAPIGLQYRGILNAM